MSGPVDLLNGNVGFERAWQGIKLHESTMRLFSLMLHCTKLGYIDHNHIGRGSSTRAGAQKA